ncbi:MAG: hypothetical protein E7497_07965 [Ruminococcus sp.]|nr:hypothetical protein [Ruminococcus sp.]MBE6862812.1 hypothetical protein [Ruminococcus sp.]
MSTMPTATSFYLWKDSDLTGDGKLHFSPAWDFDLSYNNFPASRKNSDGNIGYSYKPNNLFAVYFPINGYNESGRPTAGRSWIGELYRQEDFVKLTAEVYFERFEPFLHQLTRGETPYFIELAERIHPSAEMSNARWHTYGGADYCVFGSSSGATFLDSVEIVRNFVERRSDWLSELWSPYLFTYGDLNADGKFNVADVVALQKWLFAVSDVKLADWKSADFCNDNRLDVFDLCLMKRELLKNN